MEPLEPQKSFYTEIVAFYGSFKKQTFKNFRKNFFTLYVKIFAFYCIFKKQFFQTIAKFFLSGALVAENVQKYSNFRRLC